MAQETEDAELVALAAAVFAQSTEIQAANVNRENRGEAMAYDGYDDDGQLKALLAELRRRGRIA